MIAPSPRASAVVAARTVPGGGLPSSVGLLPFDRYRPQPFGISAVFRACTFYELVEYFAFRVSRGTLCRMMMTPFWLGTHIERA